jgi:tRNA nucleotidyltransferase/poly(A) polymerase
MPACVNLTSGAEKALAPWLDNVPPPPGGLFLVGGSIRDLLLGRPLKDLDLVCAGARDFASLMARSHAARLVPLGQDHDPPSFRVVSARDHRDYLDITERAGPDIISDLGRRDFTANALALRLDNTAPALIDPFQGAKDIRHGLLRMVKPSSLEDDPLRILRGFRLRVQLRWSIEPETRHAMTAAAPLLTRTAGERIAAELRLILEGPEAHPALREMTRGGVLETLFPQITAMRGCLQNRHHHLDVLDHSLEALACCEALLAEPATFFKDLSAAVRTDLSGWRLPWLKLAVLLHDLGKPGTLGRNPRTGQATFYGHDALGAQLFTDVARRLHLSTAESGYITGLIRHHLHVGAILTPTATTRARMRLLRRLGADVIPAVLLCLADTRAALGPASTPGHRHAQHEQGLRLIRDSLGQARETLSAPALLSGHDLIAMGLRPGPDLGRVLRMVREAQDVGEIKDREEAVRLARMIVEKM